MKGRIRMKNNKALIGVFAVIIAAAVIIMILVAKNVSAPSQEQPTPEPAVTATSIPETEASPSAEAGAATPENTGADAEQEQKVYTPTFMYFVSNSDEGYDATMVMLEELKKEFDGKVNFDIRNIDEEPELVDRFPVKDQTPTLIMLNTKNDISNILFKTKDKEKLTAAITSALEAE